jgi:hypothetical protein
MYPGLASLLESMKVYHSNLCKLKPVRKTNAFSCGTIFILKTIIFTKTGSGQTQDKQAETTARFSAGARGFLPVRDVQDARPVRQRRLLAVHLRLRTWGKNGLFPTLYTEMIVLPRQARDKHRESIQKTTVCSQVYSSTIEATKTGEIDKAKADYTWSTFMPGCLAMCNGCFKELEMEQFCKDLLAEEDDDA